MDPQGNLYDLEGNLIGQAADSDEGSNDEQEQFQDEGPKGKKGKAPGQRPKQELNDLPPVGSKKKRSHSP